MPKKKQNTLAVTKSTTYYVVRVVQRLSLLFAASSTILLWAVLASLSHGQVFVNATGAEYIDADAMFDGMGQEVDILTTYAVAFALLALLINLLAWQLPRVRRFEKRLVVDGVVIAGFCLVVSMWSQPILRFILAQVTK